TSGSFGSPVAIMAAVSILGAVDAPQELPMSRRRKDPLRPLTDDERRELTRLNRSAAAPAGRVARAAMLLAVAGGSDYQAAARAAGRKSGDAVSRLVARFHREGLAALDPRHGGGHRPTDDTAATDRILREV